MTTYEYFQPEYVKKFQCDGQTCSDNCCKKGWLIFIDKKTYKKYSHLKPKSVAKEILLHIKKNNLPIEGDYLLRLDKDNKCPFLTEDNLCGIQRKYGEDFLSETCRTYPRTTWNIGKIYERSLTLTCPAAAKLILLEKDPLKFEKIEVPEEIHNPKQFQISPKILPPQILDYFVSIQETSIRILQERSLTIDRRLLMLGLYCDRLDELLETGINYEIPKVNPSYQDTAFLQEQAAQLSVVLKFDVQNYIKAMLGILETLYGKRNEQTPEDRKFIDAVTNMLKIETDEENQTSINEIAQNYLALSEKRQKFLAQFETIFENYLVNEFFLNLYPLRANAVTVFNFGLFVAIYKMLELLTFAIATENENFTESELVEMMSWYANNIDHKAQYFQKILDYLQSQKDVVDIMQSMLQC